MRWRLPRAACLAVRCSARVVGSILPRMAQPLYPGYSHLRLRRHCVCACVCVCVVCRAEPRTLLSHSFPFLPHCTPFWHCTSPQFPSPHSDLDIFRSLLVCRVSHTLFSASGLLQSSERRRATRPHAWGTAKTLFSTNKGICHTVVRFPLAPLLSTTPPHPCTPHKRQHSFFPGISIPFQYLHRSTALQQLPVPTINILYADTVSVAARRHCSPTSTCPVCHSVIHLLLIPPSAMYLS